MPCPAHAGLLSWGWTKETGLHRHLCPPPLHRPSLSGCLSRGHRARPLPDEKQASQPSAPGCQSRSLVPSSWFRTTSTAFSARRLEGLLHPSADHGVRLVSCATAETCAFPATLPPLEELPRPAVGSPVTRCLGPLDVPPRFTWLPRHSAVSSDEIRGRLVEAAIFEALSVESVRNVVVRCRTPTPCPSWASDSSSRLPTNPWPVARPRHQGWTSGSPTVQTTRASSRGWELARCRVRWLQAGEPVLRPP
jgi:hypothetical protein